MIPIVQKGQPVLREIAKEVPAKNINSPKIQGILARMKVALDSQDDGVAIAAPQIGESLRIFIVSERVLDLPASPDLSERSSPSATADRQASAQDDVSEQRKKLKDENKNYGHLVFINPTLTKISKDKALLEEGCLSVRYLYGKIKRATKATVTAQNEQGKKFTRGGSGLMAQIFQHEIDHLDGKLFIDKAVDVKEIPPQELNKDSRFMIQDETIFI